ncbi:MAG: DUF1549 domain-containing protein, partial [Pirellulaceae bacterium]
MNRWLRYCRTASAMALVCVPSGMLSAQDNPLTKIEVFPANVHLTTVRDHQTLVVQATYANGITQDVTGQSQWTLSDPAVAKLEGAKLVPGHDGDAQLTVAFGGQTLQVPVHVERFAEDPPISFRLDVMPVFMKTGCNTGSCHGAARGKDGFRLSLFGFDPEGDYQRLTREINARRVNLALTEESLLLEKATNAVPHSGGAKIKKGDVYYQSLHRWLEAGVPNDPGPVPQVVELEIYPKGAVLDGENSTQQLTVRAKYSDGTDRDVTHLAYFSTNNENSASVSQEGVVTAKNRGEAFLMARYDTHTVGRHFIVLPKGLQFTAEAPPQQNYIDALVDQKLANLRINASPLCTDEEYLRRVYLDILGTLPTEPEYQAFMTSQDPKKRDALVDSLLERKEFVEMWVMKWSELLMIRSSQQVSYKAMLLYYSWLQQRIQNNIPIDQM